MMTGVVQLIHRRTWEEYECQRNTTTSTTRCQRVRNRENRGRFQAAATHGQITSDRPGTWMPSTPRYASARQPEAFNIQLATVEIHYLLNVPLG